MQGFHFPSGLQLGGGLGLGQNTLGMGLGQQPTSHGIKFIVKINSIPLSGIPLVGGLNLGGGLGGGATGLGNTNKGLLGGLNLAGTQKRNLSDLSDLMTITQNIHAFPITSTDFKCFQWTGNIQPTRWCTTATTGATGCQTQDPAGH